MNLLVTNEDSVILVDNSVIAIMKHDNMRLKVRDESSGEYQLRKGISVC